MEEPIDRSTCWSIPCDSEIIYHPSACVMIIHCEVELWYIFAAIAGQGRGVIAISYNTNTDTNMVWDVDQDQLQLCPRQKECSKWGRWHQSCRFALVRLLTAAGCLTKKSVVSASLMSSLCEMSGSVEGKSSNSILSEEITCPKEQMFTCKVAHSSKLACKVM